MPKYLDLEAHYEADMSAILGIKKAAENSDAKAQEKQTAQENESKD